MNSGCKNQITVRPFFSSVLSWHRVRCVRASYILRAIPVNAAAAAATFTIQYIGGNRSIDIVFVRRHKSSSLCGLTQFCFPSVNRSPTLPLFCPFPVTSLREYLFTKFIRLLGANLVVSRKESPWERERTRQIMTNKTGAEPMLQRHFLWLLDALLVSRANARLVLHDAVSLVA